MLEMDGDSDGSITEEELVLTFSLVQMIYFLFYSCLLF